MNPIDHSASASLDAAYPLGTGDSFAIVRDIINNNDIT